MKMYNNPNVFDLMSSQEKILILDHYYKEDSEVKKKTVRWVRNYFNRSTFNSSSLRGMLKVEDKIRGARDKRKKSNRESVPQWPDMEVRHDCIYTVCLMGYIMYVFHDV